MCSIMTNDVKGNEILTFKEFGRLVKQIDTSTLIGLRDLAIIRLQFSAFCRVEAICLCRTSDITKNGSDLDITLRTKKGGAVTLNCGDYRHVLDEYMLAARFNNRKNQPLFQTFISGTDRLSGRVVTPHQVHRRIGIYANAAKIKKVIGSNSIRMSGLLDYLDSGGKLEDAAEIANISLKTLSNFYYRFKRLGLLR